MFVPCDPYNCLDVFKPNDRCVCGCSALVTSHQGEDTGYCSICSEKRRKFAEAIIGNIDVEENSILSIIEEMRKSYYRERIYYLVECFFATHQQNSFTEPYNDDSFIVKAYYEKQIMAERFIETLQKTPKLKEIQFRSLLLSSKNGISSVSGKIENYQKKLSKMIADDWNKIAGLNSSISKSNDSGDKIR
ncbi:MAG: hypothetical protein PHE54_01165 [Bacilli bacterium]|nr:hypothetical protein [Bacilli bacterium]